MTSYPTTLRFYLGHALPTIPGLVARCPRDAWVEFIAPGEEQPRWRIAPVPGGRDGTLVLGLWKRNRLASRLHLVPRFRHFAPEDLPVAFAHAVHHEAARHRDEQARADMVEIACAGCGRMQRVRATKVVPADGYTCGLGRCVQNPAFHLPRPPQGSICVTELAAAGSFSGWTIRPATPQERASIARAKALRAVAFGYEGPPRMTPHELATQLRRRQYEYEEVPRRVIDALSDAEIIDSYITCADCGQRQVSEKELAIAIRSASNAEEFFAICDRYAMHHTQRGEGHRDIGKGDAAH